MSDAENHDLFLEEQIGYYRARAGEYDEWFFRQKRYDRGPELNDRWFTEVKILYGALESFKPQGDILELACGTGIWTEQLLKSADQITAIDASSEVLDINRKRTNSPGIKYILDNLFEWQPDKVYDVVFFSFWLSHVPPHRFKSFWQMVNKALKPDGRVFFIDSQYESTSTARGHLLKGKDSTVVTRRLNDGREFQIVKVFYKAEQLSIDLRSLGWSINVLKTENYFLYGFGKKDN